MVAQPLAIGPDPDRARTGESLVVLGISALVSATILAAMLLVMAVVAERVFTDDDPMRSALAVGAPADGQSPHAPLPYPAPEAAGGRKFGESVTSVVPPRPLPRSRSRGAGRSYCYGGGWSDCGGDPGVDRGVDPVTGGPAHGGGTDPPPTVIG